MSVAAPIPSSQKRLVLSLFRQCYKKSAKVIKVYGGETNLHLSYRAVFGLALTPELPVDATYAVNSKQWIRLMFQRPVAAGETLAGRIEAAFDTMLRLDAALPSPDANKKYFEGKADLKFTDGHTPSWIKKIGDFKPRTVVPASETENFFPPRRLEVPEEPFHPIFHATQWEKFHFLVPFMHQVVSPFTSDTEFAPREKSGDQLIELLPTRTVCVTHGIEVECRTEFVGLESSPTPPHAGLEDVAAKPSFVFRYVIAIRNLTRRSQPGASTVALLSRHWQFVDVQRSTVMEVVGPGVVGEFPLLEPGDRHVYQSGTTLFSPLGVMSGTFQLILLKKNSSDEIPSPKQIDIRIAPTALRRLQQ